MRPQPHSRVCSGLRQWAAWGPPALDPLPLPQLSMVAPALVRPMVSWDHGTRSEPRTPQAMQPWLQAPCSSADPAGMLYVTESAMCLPQVGAGPFPGHPQARPALSPLPVEPLPPPAPRSRLGARRCCLFT